MRKLTVEISGILIYTFLLPYLCDVCASLIRFETEWRLMEATKL